VSIVCIPHKRDHHLTLNYSHAKHDVMTANGVLLGGCEGLTARNPLEEASGMTMAHRSQRAGASFPDDR